MTAKLIENLDISKYSVRETASTTIEFAHFNNSLSRKCSSFSPINNDTIQFYVHINPKYYTDNVSVLFLINKMNETELLVQHRVSIVDLIGQKQHTKDFVFKFVKYQPFLNFYMSRKDILKSANTLLPNGTLQVFVEALVLEEIDKPKVTKGLQKEKSVLDDLQSLLETGKLSDVVFLFKGKELKAHKNIMSARSPVFAAMFEHDLQEKLKNQVDITDIDADVFEKMLRYIYTDQVTELKKYAFDLLMAADKYQLESLKSICEKALFSELTAESFSQILVLSYLHHAPDLQKKCCDFYANHRDEIMAIKDWDKLIADKPEILLMLLKIKC